MWSLETNLYLMNTDYDQVVRREGKELHIRGNVSRKVFINGQHNEILFSFVLFS